MSERNCFKLGALFALLAIMLGAFGAHGLKAVLDEGQLATFETGVRYQFYHAVALFITGFLMMQVHGQIWLERAGYFFLVGIILFSGSLYLLACRDILPTPNWIGPITPLGGLCFMIGWALVFVSQLGKREDED
ncbi:DUF423 domain-containing protein [Hirschia maritima]|uniref:DUF423 domain-containing protein n=1 Tax=Hirschia maritima TaxID=1121961 RepID=UPI000360E1E3|nr:DUF423 domain-containing protein [Hirschia maritima]